MCDKTCIFFFFPIINKYFLMAKRSLLSRCPSYHYLSHSPCFSDSSNKSCCRLFICFIVGSFGFVNIASAICPSSKLGQRDRLNSCLLGLTGFSGALYEVIKWESLMWRPPPSGSLWTIVSDWKVWLVFMKFHVGVLYKKLLAKHRSHVNQLRDSCTLFFY